jgi:hypothetical protein
MKFGKRAYVAWVNANFSRRERAPKWHELPKQIQMSWAAVAGAVIEEYQSGEQSDAIGPGNVHD